ncbi:MAG: hypothetical protein IKP50_03685 [Bacilli bacterium]|nr:hypothetical protein [Bacilli bacterium]
MATEKTPSYLSSVKEVSTETESFSLEKAEELKRINKETQRGFKLALKKDFEGALDTFTALENEELINVIKKCIELLPIFDQFLNAEISLAQYKKLSKNYTDEVKDIVHYKYPNLEFIELKNLEKKIRDRIESKIDELLDKNTLEDLIEARKVFEKNKGIVKKPYNFNRLFIKTISFIPYSEFEPLYKLDWGDVDTLINEFLLKESNNFLRAERILKEIKVIDKNRDTIQIIVKKFNKAFDYRLRQNYRQVKLKTFVKEYTTHSFYQLDKHNKIHTKIEPFFLQRRIYAIYYLTDNCEAFLSKLIANIDCLDFVPFENQRTFYRSIINSVKVTRDYTIFEMLNSEIINGENFVSIIIDTLEEDELTIRGIVKQLKGHENQAYMESLFLRIFKKELTFADTKHAPEFNKENTEAYIGKYLVNEHEIRKMKLRKILYKTISGAEIFLSLAISLALCASCIFAFRKQLYLLGMALLIAGVILGVWLLKHMIEIINIKKERRLKESDRVINERENEKVIILKKVYLGLD